MATQKKPAKKRPRPASKNKAPKRPPTKTSWAAGESGNPATQFQPGQSGNPNGKLKYTPEHAEQALKLCRMGATNAVLADFFDVSMRTIWMWSATHEEFQAALKEGREAFDDMVERSLAQRAIGYDYVTEKVFNANGEVLRAETREHVPADVGAAKHWLGLRRKEQWASPDKIELTGKDGGPIETETRSDIEIAQRIAFALARAARSKDDERVIEHNE